MVLDYVYLILKNKLDPMLDDVELIEWDESKDAQSRKGEFKKEPALFIGFRPFSCEDVGQMIQRCTVVAEFRLITENKSDGDKRVRHNNAGHQSLAREIYIETQKIKKGLLSEIPEFSALLDTEDDFCVIHGITRVGGATQHSGDSTIRSNQQFRIVYFDYSACQDYQKLTAGFEVTNLELNP